MQPLAEKYSGKVMANGCESSAEKEWHTFLARALADLDAKEAVPLLKEVVANNFSASPKETRCIQAYLDILADLDGVAWSTFPFWYSGAAYDKVIYGLDAVKDGRMDLLARTSPIDPDASHVENIQALFEKLGFCERGRECEKGISFYGYAWDKSDYVKIHSPTQMDYFGNIKFTRDDTVAGTFTLILRATGDPERPWIAEDVRDVTLDETQRTANQAFRLYEKKNYAEALALWNAIVDQHPEAQYYVGVLYANGLGVAQNLETAIEWYRQAAEQGNLKGQHALAWLYATSSDPHYHNSQEAVRYALKVVAQAPDHWSSLDVLAAAYARNGQFQEAIAAQEQAVDLSKKPGLYLDWDIKQAIKARLGLYKEHKAYLATD
jgi:hypothetical protein